MRLTLIRHGEAGDDAPSDEQRALTKKGRADARRVGRALARRGVRFHAVISSPLVRAVQTAELVVGAMDQRVRITVSEALLPEARPTLAVALIASLAHERSLALVAHEPILSRLAAALLGLSKHPALRKGEALRIRLADATDPTGASRGKPGAARWRIDPHTGHRERL